MQRRKLLTVGHSYAVALNRKLADAVARAGDGRWDVTAVGPALVHGDLRPIAFEPDPTGAYAADTVPTYCKRLPHLMVYGRKLKRLLAAEWDVVHTWEEPYVLSGWQIGRWARPARFVFYTFQNIAKRYPPPFGWLEKATVHRAAGWIAAGNSVAQTLLPRPGYAARPHGVIGLGVDTDLFRPDAAARANVRRTLGWEVDGPPVIGFLGRFIPAKGLTLLTRALDAIASDWRALFVGGGHSERELRTWAGRHGDRCRVVTGVPHAGVPAYLNAMDVLVAPSQTTPRWREQFGRMLVEGFACGLAVVGSDSGEIPHVIAEAGRVVGEADTQGWTAALAELIDSPGQRTELASRGLERVHAHFSWPVIGRAHVEFFESLLDTPKREPIDADVLPV